MAQTDEEGIRDALRHLIAAVDILNDQIAGFEVDPDLDVRGSVAEHLDMARAEVNAVRVKGDVAPAEGG